MQSLPSTGSALLYKTKATDEFLRSSAQRGFRINPQIAGHIDQDKKNITELGVLFF